MKKNKANSESPIPQDLFDILACPLCRSEIEYTKDKKGLLCSGCGAKYPISHGIPILLPRKK